MSLIHMSTFDIVVNCILVCAILVGVIGLKVIKKKQSKQSNVPKKNKVELKSETSRKIKEADELSAILHESDEDYNDEDWKNI